MSADLQPIYLFSDSQMLFWRTAEGLFLNSIRKLIKHNRIKAAYIGASNGDNPEFYGIFKAAMESIEIDDCRMILCDFSPEDQAFVNQADIILLAGGDVERGWQIFQQVGLKQIIPQRYQEGALLIGISAGAIQLGMFDTFAFAPEELTSTFKLVPVIIGVHDEKQEWESLKRVTAMLNGYVKGIGIPLGGGLAYHADQTIEPLRYPLHEFSLIKDEIAHHLLFPHSEE
jgi:hypothetical protein